MEIKQIEFEKLRHAYVTVKSFLESRSGVNITSLADKVECDLGLSGDDNYEFLEEFVTKFELDHRNFEYSKHFYSEAELFVTGAAIVNLLTLSVWLPLKTIELLTFNKVSLDKPVLPVRLDRQVSDLTFRDLLTWYIEKEYKLGGEVRYEINARD